WLRHHCYQEWARAERMTREPRLWEAWLGTELPVIEYGRFMESDEGMVDWITALLDYGIVLLTGAPAEVGQLQHLADRIGPIRLTNFGSIFDVISKPNPNASADTPMGLELHHDLPNWRHPPDIQLLFCIANEAQGGSSIYADSFKIVADLRAEEPEVFERLSRQMFEFRFHDESCDHRARAPMIELDPDGRVTRVRFNNWLRAPFDIPESDIESTYQALRRFWMRLRDRRYKLRRKLEPGEMIAVANARVMHGRDPFDRSTGHRHMQGCLMDMDWVLSALRLIERRRNHHPHFQNSRHC
ncbi:MAG: TauD/TfdA family dioxygenase, partial [Phycisphaerales bacterium]|nr:TauD/TfdA family dioxygenase [Phycisphaerales bacterium]